jgi:hypothetical protein
MALLVINTSRPLEIKEHILLMPSDRHIAWLAFCKVIRLAVGVAGMVLERPPEYLTTSVGEDGDGVVNCYRDIHQGVSSLSCGWGRWWGRGLQRWVAVPMQFTNLFTPALTSLLFTPTSKCMQQYY